MGAADRVTRLLADPDPLVRAAAASALRSLPPDDRLVRLDPLLSDPMRSVREAAAKALADARPAPGTVRGQSLETARQEWSDAMSLRSDFPETQLQIGGAALQARDFARALQAFERAVTLDPQIVEAWSMVVRLHAALGDADAARAALQRGLAANPGDGRLLSLQ
jgi:tetratricopeptide (TPR) repeat protein